jgi:hypothetical protein
MFVSFMLESVVLDPLAVPLALDPVVVAPVLL